MLKRTLSAVIGLGLLLFTVYLGGPFLILMALAMSLKGLHEFFRALKGGGYKPFATMAYLATVFLYTGLFFDFPTEFVFFTIYILVFLLLIENIFAESNRLIDVGLTVLAFVYIAISLYHIVLFARSEHASLIWLIFIVAWMTDTSAYFSGMFLGRTKLIPSVSPKKTVEGAVGGIIGATVLGMIYIYWVMGGIQTLWLIPILMAGSALSQLGDLVASKIKRGFQIKDFGNIMPGHGGVLDRFDSILIVAPYVYYAISIATKAPF